MNPQLSIFHFWRHNLRASSSNLLVPIDIIISHISAVPYTEETELDMWCMLSASWGIFHLCLLKIQHPLFSVIIVERLQCPIPDLNSTPGPQETPSSRVIISFGGVSCRKITPWCWIYSATQLAHLWWSLNYDLTQLSRPHLCWSQSWALLFPIPYSPPWRCIYPDRELRN